ncbi:hypothetical protein [Dethiobacter alkaliphilus]|uniref:hypothetical protein n=1 Tax=Dethiobacter alkaliphilus TaxID=427926 RepID=UPI0002FDDF92|nr:hypothetical protein [Dethiobacter alkaliphilus]MCW3489747.1 hypothetical protein [Dethiobacter alkaliphilus]
MPVINLGEPPGNLEDYQQFVTGEVVLHYPKKLEAERKAIIISVAKLFKWKKLSVEWH